MVQIKASALDWLSKSYLLTVLLFFALSFISFKNTFDVHLHDTYYVVDNNFIFQRAAVLFFCYWLIYAVFSYVFISKTLLWWHLLGSLVLLAFIVICSLLMPDFETTDGVANGQRISLIRTTSKAALLLIAWQCFFLINLIIGAIKKSVLWFLNT